MDNNLPEMDANIHGNCLKLIEYANSIGKYNIRYERELKDEIVKLSSKLIRIDVEDNVKLEHARLVGRLEGFNRINNDSSFLKMMEHIENLQRRLDYLKEKNNK